MVKKTAGRKLSTAFLPQTAAWRAQVCAIRPAWGPQLARTKRDTDTIPVFAATHEPQPKAELDSVLKAKLVN
jgi:hypothetical protein